MWGYGDGRPDGMFGVLLGIGWSITAFIAFLIWVAILVLLVRFLLIGDPRREALPHAERPRRRGLPAAADASDGSRGGRRARPTAPAAKPATPATKPVPKPRKPAG